MKRRLLALLLSVMMILSLAPTAVFAEESDDAVKEGDPVVITTEEPAEEPSEDPEKEQPNRDSLSEEALAAQTAGNSGESAEGGTQPINVAKVGTTEYADIAEAIAVWGPGKTLTLLADVTYNQTVDVEVNATKSTQNWILDLGDYTWTANGCNAFRLYAAGGTVMNQNYGLKVYANENGGITATNKYCIECKYDISTKGYRPRLEIHGGTYSGSYIIYYKSLTCNDDNVSNGPSVFFEASTNGSEPIFNGGFALAKCPITINAGYFNGTTFNTYPVSSTADTNLNGGHFKTLSAFPDPKNNKGIMYNNRRLLFYNDGSFDVLSSVSENEYEAALTPVTVILTGNRGYNGSKSSLYESPILFKKADYAIQSYIKNGIEIVLNANVEAKQDITISSGTFTIDATAEGAAYTGTVTLSGTSGTFILKGAAATSVTVTNSDYLLRKSVDGTTYTLVKKSDCEAQIGYVGYATLADAIAAAEPTDEITVLKKAYYLNREVAANSTVTVSAPVTESGTSAMQINITAEGETEPEVVYVVSDNASAIVTTTVDNSVITNIDVPTVLASVARSDSKSVVISLSKEAATEAEKEAAGLKETDLAFEIHPVAIVTNANDATEVVAIDSKAGATWQFALDLGVANAGKTVCLWHHSGNEKTSLGVFVVNEEGKVNDVTMNSFSVVSVEFAVASAVVNNTLTYYDNLAEAIANADDGTTVTLLANVTGGGLFVGPNKFTTTGLTIDFNGKTYTVETPVGSTGTVNQALHFERGNEITLKGGTINVTNDSSKLAAFEMFMQNYGALTVENMNLDGTGIAVATYSDPKYEAYPEWYKTEKPQFNYNTAGNSVIRNSTITMPGALGVDDAAALRIEDDAVINVSAIATKGTDQRYASATSVVNVENGAQFKLSGDGGAATAFEAYLAAKGQSLGTPTNGVYTVEAQKVAQIGNTKYETLQAAIAAAADGDTITLLADIHELEGGSKLTIDKAITITGPVDANDEPLYTIYGKSSATGTNYIFIAGSGNVTLSNLKIKNFGNNAATNSAHAPIYVSTNYTGHVTLDNLHISDFNRGGIFLYGGTFNVEGCDINCANSRPDAFTKGIEIKGTAHGTIVDTSIYNMERSSASDAPAGIEIYGRGSVVVDSCTIISDCTGHKAGKATYGIVSSRVGEHDPSGGSLLVKDTTISTTNGALSVADSDDYGPVNNYSMTVEGSSFENYIATWSDSSSITINSGEFAEDVYADAGTIIIHGGNFTKFSPYTRTGSIVIDGGTFDAPVPEAYCATGYIPVVNGNGTYSVKQGTYVAQIGNAKYESLADAFAAITDNTATTIEVLADSTGAGIVVPSGRNITVNFNNHTYTVNSAPLAGSTGTQNQCFQLLADSTIAFNNGTIAADNANVKMLIQNYSNLTLNGMTLNATQGTNNIRYVVSTNNGSTTINNTNITAKENGVAFDVCTGWGGYTSNAVEVTGTSTITGDVEVSFYGKGTAPTLTLTSGTLIGNIVVDEAHGGARVTVTKVDAGFTAKAPEGYRWVSVNGVSTLTAIPYMAQIGNTKYETLAEAIAAVPTDGTKTTITMIGDETINVATNPLTIVANKNVVLDLNGHEVVGQCNSGTSSALITNRGTLAIKDSSNPSTGKLIGGASPTWTWDGTDNYAGSYASNLINNYGTLVVNGGILYNASTGSAAYAIDNYGAGNVTINGGTLDAAYASAIRMFNNNGGAVTINAGTIGGEHSYMGVQVMDGTDADLTINGGTINAKNNSYSVYSNGTDDSSVTISGGTFTGYVGFSGSLENENISITGGTFGAWVGTFGEQTGFITGGTFDVQPAPEYINWTKTVSKKDGIYYVTDANAVPMDATVITQIVYSGEYYANKVYYYWQESGGFSGDICDFYQPFENPWLMKGEFIELKGNVTLNRDLTFTTEGSGIAVTGGTFTLTFGNYDINLNNYDFVLPAGVSCVTDKQTNIFSAPAGYELVETANQDGTYTYSVEAINYVAQIGDVKYETFEAAWNAAAKYDTITLLTDVEVSGNLNRTQYYDITINGDGHKITLSGDVTQGDGYWLFFKDVTLDLNGHTYHNTGRLDFRVDSGTTIILDSSYPSAGKIDGERLYVGGTGELKIQSGTVNAEINSEGGKVEVSGGYVNILATQDHTTGTVVNVTGGELFKLYMNAGEATISGGTIIYDCYTGKATTTIKGTAMLQCKARIENDGTLGGTLNVTGGTIAGGGKYAIYSAGPNTINISGGTLTSNTYAIVFCGPGEDSGSTATLNITGGSITGSAAIGGNAEDINPRDGKSDRGGTVINISGGTITGTSATGAAIYHPQAGVLNISEAANITGVTGIEMRDGTLNVSGGTITATGKPTSSTSNDSGTTTLGAGIAVAQHTTKKPINVSVTGGTISGYTPFVEVNPEKNDEEYLARITLSISGGTFTTTNDGTQAVYVKDFGKVNNKSNTGFITGGIYSTEPNEAYLATGYIPVDNGDGSYTVEAQKVAQIGDVKYETFEAAWNAANDGDTITLLADCAGNGLVAAQNRFNTSGLTVNFNNHTYTVDGTLVGSTGTETQAFQLLKNNKITFQNGTITSAKAKMLIQNYSNLTLDNMTLTLNNPNYASAYTLSNNNGDVVIDDTTINANPAGGFAFDVCRYASYPSVNVTVMGDSVINGNVEISASGSDPKDGFSLTLESGTMTGNIVVDATAAAAMEATPAKAKVTKDDDFDQAAPVGYLWSAADANGVQTLSKGAATLTHGQTITTYATLEEAFAHAADGDTINLVANCNGNGIIVAQDAFATNGLTVNFNGFTYTVDGSILAGSTGTKTQAFQLLKGNKITFNGGTIVADNANVKMLIQNYSNLTLNGMTLNATRGTNAVEYVLSTNNDSTTINNTNITAKENGVAFDVCTGWGGYTSNTVAVTGSSAISGDIEVSFYGEGTAPSLALNGGTHTGAIVMEQGADQATITKANAFTQDAPAGYVWVSNDDGTSTLVPKVYVAEIEGGAKYESLADALAAAVNGDKITIIADFAIDASKIAETDRIVVNKAVTIDFGEYTMSVPGELEPTANWAALFIDADVTITGTTGGIDCRDKENDSECGVYAFNVRNNATLTITGGHYHGGGTIVQAQLGHVVIEGGEFTVTPFDVPYGSNYALNCVDAAYQNGTAGFAIKGGTFVGFDPQDIAAEGEHTDFTDNGYVAIEQSTAGTFVVQPGYNVTFDADGGAPEPAAQRVAAGGKATEPATAPTKAGFTFDGWLLNDNAFDFNTVLTADIKLVALWTPEQTVGKCKASVSLTLSENINMNLYVYDLAEGTEAADYTIEATFNGNPKKTFQLGTDTLTVVQEGVTKYKMTVAEVYSYQMGIPVTITVKYQGSVVGTFDYTVKQFFSSKIINASSSEALKNLSKAGLDYGAAAQLYFDGKTYNAGVYQTHPENLVNAEFNQNNTVNATQPTNYSLSSAGNCPEGLSKVSVALVLGSETSIKVYFKYSGDINNLDIKAIRKDNENVRTVTEPVQESGGRYSVKITGIRSYELCQYFTITFSDNANSISLNYSPYYYAQKNWENEDMLLANLCHALVAYGDYAKAMWPND